MQNQLLEGLIDLNPASGALPEQIYRAVGDAVRSGRLRAGAHLPGSRELAGALGISRNSVNAGYELLRADGVIAVRRGAAPVVAGRAALEVEIDSGEDRSPRLSGRGAAIATDLRSPAYMCRDRQMQPGTPDEALFPNDDWARTLRRVSRRRYGDDAIYANSFGLPALTGVLADYLVRHRGVRARGERIVVMPSLQAGLSLLAQCLADPGDTVWHESPGYLGARAAFIGAGLDIAPLPVGPEGADPDRMGPDAPAPRLIYVTPSHQYPTGARMPLPGRLALIEKACSAGAVILEDDYDSEFLWQGRPIAALQGLSESGNVVYLGTTAKSLLPGLRLAYMVVPDALAAPLRRAMRNMGMMVNVHVQAAFAEFIETGQFAAHLRRIARSYEARGRLLVDVLVSRLGGAVEVTMPMGGLQLVARLGEDVDDVAVSHRLMRAGFNTPDLSSLCLGARERGLIVGFSTVTEALAHRFADELERALD